MLLPLSRDLARPAPVLASLRNLHLLELSGQLQTSNVSVLRPRADHRRCDKANVSISYLTTAILYT